MLHVDVELYASDTHKEIGWVYGGTSLERDEPALLAVWHRAREMGLAVRRPEALPAPTARVTGAASIVLFVDGESPVAVEWLRSVTAQTPHPEVLVLSAVPVDEGAETRWIVAGAAEVTSLATDSAGRIARTLSRITDASDRGAGPSPVAWPNPLTSVPLRQLRESALEALETAYVLEVIERASGSLSAAARLADMDRTNFRRVVHRVEARRGEPLPRGGAGGRPSSASADDAHTG